MRQWKPGKLKQHLCPSITFSFYKDNLDAEVLARPQLRIEEGEKAQLVIGNRVPILDICLEQRDWTVATIYALKDSRLESDLRAAR